MKLSLVAILFIKHSRKLTFSNSALKLGTKKRLGFRKKQVTLFSVHRSEEVVPQTARHLVKQTTSVSSDGEGSLSNESGAK